MVQKNEHHTFTGMQKDIAISKHPSKYLFDARNIRLTQREDGSTLLAITNEKGTEDTELEIGGIYLGHCVLNQYLVVFSKDVYSGDDHIERFDLSQDPIEKESLYDDPLNFSLEHPIEAIGSYENEDVQKVYWTDGYNQPRVINIMNTVDGPEDYAPTDTYFDFVNTLKLEEEVEVQKMFGNNGMFAPGVIQYAFTYYHKYGQESNIFYTTPLYYISFRDRGASPEDKVVENAFKITVKHIDSNFEYLRIYSIQRTSINGTPIVKRVQDISLKDIENDTVSFIDTGTTGNTVDPTELLYKGGEYVKAETIEQKDGTLFLGNIQIGREQKVLSGANINSIKSTLLSDYRYINPTNISESTYIYDSQLTAYESDVSGTQTSISTPCAGFKRGNYYRLGIQFQHETGRWGDPIYLDDLAEQNSPKILSNNSRTISLPCFTGTINSSIVEDLLPHYKKARAVVVYPELQDRITVCQGVVNPTMFTSKHRNVDKDLWAQSSWFFRAYHSTGGDTDYTTGAVRPECGNSLTYMSSISTDLSTIREVEVQGDFNEASVDNNKFIIDKELLTFHSPDVDFNDDYKVIDYSGFKHRRVGHVIVGKTLSDISIQTETPTISANASGFFHKSFIHNNNYGIVSGLFYEDFVVDDDGDGDKELRSFRIENSPVKWMVYTWNKSGSLNNDINRPANAGTRSAVLKKKIISNLRFTTTYWDTLEAEIHSKILLFDSDQLSIVKLGEGNNNNDNPVYMGNIDTLLMPEQSDGMYFAFNGDYVGVDNSVDFTETPFTSTSWWKTHLAEIGNTNFKGLFKLSENSWLQRNDNIGNNYVDLLKSKEGVRIKYKSTPHLVLVSKAIVGGNGWSSFTVNDGLPIVEVGRDTVDTNIIFGGKTADALKANTWIPCGEPVKLIEGEDAVIKWSWGDTYYQRWDCLKTYAFTPEDINQVVEIGSFMLETYVNIDGRYDRNRGQLSNLNMSPQNFNLLNPVYSQLNNFFTYKILDEDYYKNNTFPNQITWTKEKHAGADVDLWTNITLASTYDMDGSKGKIVSLNAWKDQLFCFQDKGISNILFNSRVQIPTSDGVPIEISNNYKVDGYRYLSDGIGCSNKWTIRETPASIYFIDSTSHHLYSIGDGFINLTVNKNMGSWFNSNGALINKTVYDDVHHDVYLVKDDEALCYSELLGEFTSFMDYGGINVLESYQGKVFSMKGSLSDKHLYKMFTGNYNYFFDDYKPWYLTFISNGIDESAMDFDKIFSNIDYRLDFFDEGIYDPDETFDYMRAWNEYQDTQEVTLSTKNDGKGYKTAKFYRGGNPQKKFRIWRIQIPRAKKLKNGQYVPTNDRMRNPWCKITLGKNADESNMKAVLQDLNVQYFL